MVEWVIQDISHKKVIQNPGEPLYSPAFTVNLDGRSKVLRDAKLVFYPQGSSVVTRSGFCSLFLIHPLTPPSVDRTEAAAFNGGSPTRDATGSLTLMEQLRKQRTRHLHQPLTLFTAEGIPLHERPERTQAGRDASGSALVREAGDVDNLWFRYKLKVGRESRGVFDTIYKGNDNFCELQPEIDEDTDTLTVAVEFIPEEQHSAHGGLMTNTLEQHLREAGDNSNLSPQKRIVEAGMGSVEDYMGPFSGPPLPNTNPVLTTTTEFVPKDANMFFPFERMHDKIEI